MYVSLKDVAARAGVSFQTAGRVLSGSPVAVSEGTRERITTAARELGYVPNALARGLVRGSSPTIGILAENVADLPLSQMIVAAQRAASAAGHAALLVSAQPDADVSLEVRKLLEHRVSGLLVVAPNFEEDPGLGQAVRGSRLPAVSLHHVHGGRVPLVGSDVRSEGALVAEHLLGLGHRVIGVVTGPPRRRVSSARLHGFRTTLRDAGVPVPARRVVAGDWTFRGGYLTAVRLLDDNPELTAIWAQNDFMAIGALRALQERRVKVPHDLSIVGCDDLTMAAYASTPLTTVHLPFHEIGERAAMRLLARMRGEPIPRRDLLAVRLVVRKSTGAPSSAHTRTAARRGSRVQSLREEEIA